MIFVLCPTLLHTYICDEPKLFTFFLILTAHCAQLMTHSQNTSSKQTKPKAIYAVHESSKAPTNSPLAVWGWGLSHAGSKPQVAPVTRCKVAASLNLETLENNWRMTGLPHSEI